MKPPTGRATGTLYPFWTAAALFALALVLFIGRCLVETGFLSIPLDDGWIHLSFARNLAAGRGFCLGLDETPVSGSTAPLWTFLLALGLLTGMGPVTAALGLGLACALAALAAAAALGRTLAGNRLGALLTAGGLALAPRFVWGALSGMEVPLFTFLVTLALWLQLRGRSSWAGPLVGSLAGWARPECFAVGAFLALLSLFRSEGRPGRSLPSLLAGPVAFLLPLAGWLFFHASVYGHLLPTTFYVKAAGSSPLSVENAGELLPFLTLYPLMQMAALIGYIGFFNPFLCSGPLLALKKRRKGILATVLLILFFGAARGFLGFAGPWLQHGRYYTFLYPLLLALSAAGLTGEGDRKATGVVGVLPHIGMVLLMGGLLLAPAAAWSEGFRLFLLDDPGARLDPDQALSLLPLLVGAPVLLYLLYTLLTARRPPAAATGALLTAAALAWAGLSLWIMAGGYARNVAETEKAHVGMARHVAAHTPPGAVIACHDIGALGFFGERKLLDLVGIATPEVLFWREGRPADRLDYLRTRRPDYLCFIPGWFNRALAGLAEDVAAGRLEYREVHRIEMPETVTIGGRSYLLVRLRWRDG